MRIVLGLCLAALVAAACASSTNADSCEKAGGACVQGTAQCDENMPFDCGTPNTMCCRPKAPPPTSK